MDPTTATSTTQNPDRAGASQSRAPTAPRTLSRSRPPASARVAWGTVAALTLGALGACSGSAILGSAPAGPGNIPQTTDTAGAGDVDGGTNSQPDVASDVAGPGDAFEDPGPDVAPVPSVWEPVSLGDSGELSAVATSPTGLAVAAAGDRVLRSAGVGWAPYGVPQAGGSLRGVWTDGDVVVAVGLGGLIARRDNPASPWVLTEPGDVGGGGGPVDLWAVSGRAADDLWAVGDEATILHYDGAAWTLEHAGTQLDLRAVFVPASVDAPVVAVGTRGRILQATASGGWVLKQVASSAVTLRGVWGDATGGELFVVGTGGTITHRSTAQAVWQGQSSNDAAGRDL